MIFTACVAAALAAAPVDPDRVDWSPEGKTEPDLRDPAEAPETPPANADDLQMPVDLETVPEGEERLVDTKRRQESEREARESAATTSDAEAEPPPPRPRHVADHGDESRRIRIAGIATMTAGGVLAVTGLTLVVTFFARGNRFAEDLDDALERSDDFCFSAPSSRDCRRAELDAENARENGRMANGRALIGVGITVGGIVALVAGGAVYAHGTRRDREDRKVSIAPARRGVSLSGRF